MKDVADLIYDISKCEIVTLATDVPAIKPRLMFELVTRSIKLGKQVHYLDFDLQFSSLLQNLPDDKYDELDKELLQVIQPREWFDWFLPFGGRPRNSGTVVLDSINTVQNMILNKQTSTTTTRANHHSAVLLSVLQQLTRFHSKNIIAVNLMRARPKFSQNQQTVWHSELVGGRMIRFKSDLTLFASASHEEQKGDSNIVKIRVSDFDSARFGGKVGDVYQMSRREMI